tara:strand:+ start:184 stop:663 length:480 start_codon:yes stop_codon:yes gene_type:complete
MRNDQLFVLLLLIFLPLSGCVTETEDNSEGEEEGVVMDVEIESNDSVNSVSSESNDELIDVTLLSENEFNLTELEFIIKYTNDGTLYVASCSHGDDDPECTFSAGDGDPVWEQNETLTISEYGVNICDTGDCSLDFSISSQASDGNRIMIHSNTELTVN